MEKVLKFVAPVEYYRCRKCGWRSGRLQLKGRRTEKWATRLVNAFGIFLLLSLLSAIALFFLLNRPSE